MSTIQPNTTMSCKTSIHFTTTNQDKKTLKRQTTNNRWKCL